MTARRYAPLLELAVRHTYYHDGRCPDLAIRADAATERLAANHRLLMRHRPDGVDVSAPVDDDGRPFIALPADAVFRWEFRLRTADFALFTDLAARPPLQFLGGPSSAPEQTLALNPDPAPETVAPDAFATAEVGFDSTPSTNGALFRRAIVSFTAGSARWAYYCVTDLPEESGRLAITDNSAQDPVRFGDTHRRDLVATPDPDDDVAQQLAARYPELRRLRFVSDETVPHRQQTRDRLELRLGDQRLLGPLPNPVMAPPNPLQVVVDGAPAEIRTLPAVITLASS